MEGRRGLVGRAEERRRLLDALERARGGSGSIVLLAGEAGVGKTRLAQEATAAARARVLAGSATHAGTGAYEPVAAALRSHLRAAPDAFEGLGPLLPHLALLLPELGRPAKTSDRATLFEAVLAALAHVAADQPAVLLLDDLHWSDGATLELLSALANQLDELALLIVAAYRSDGLPRDHAIRRLRNDLRRADRLDELVLDPLGPDETAALLGELLGEPASPSLVRVVQDRTHGVPFFVEELARVLPLRQGRRGLELAATGTVPLPETIRDAVLVGAADLSEAARVAADTAAVMGEPVDLALVSEIASDSGLGELLGAGLLVEDGAGSGRFRHALARDALYADISWLRRRALHREVAEALERAAAPASRVAPHWVAARDVARARAALLQAAADAESLHAYRDGAAASREALELWVESDEEADSSTRIETLERYAHCSELAGDLTEAVRAWREISDIRRARGEGELLAEAQRRLAAAHDLKGDRDASFAARRTAAEAFAASGRPGEAAADRLAMANHLRLSGKHVAAAELARTAALEAKSAERLDLELRARGLEGMARAKGEDFEGGLATVRDALGVAVEHDLTAVAAELYQRLSLVLYDAADYVRAQEALETALELCRASGASGTEEACVSCLAYVLRDRGDWTRAGEVCRDMIAADTSRFVAEGLLGSVHAFQGRLSSARRLLTSSLAVSSAMGHYNMTVDATTALAFVAAAEQKHDEAAEHCRALLARWSESDDHHYALSGLRWSAAYFCGRGQRADAHACTEALTRMASRSGHPEALAALAHAIGEAALLDHDADTAAEQLSAALDLHGTLDMPFVRAQIELRCGVALAAAGEREAGLERLVSSYRTAKKLGARPLAAEVAGEMHGLGDSIVKRVGRRAAAEVEGAGLSRREHEVVRLLAVGHTNKEIAHSLFLSTRTVDMHVRNVLRKLDCRSRVEAANRANELGLLG